MNPPVLATHRLDVGYKLSRKRAHVVLSDITIELHAGEFACLLGANGTGKSTLLRTLAGMQKPLAGRVTLGEDELHQLSDGELARRLSVVLTERVGVGVLPVYDLVGLGRYPHTGWGGRLSAADHEVVRWALAITGSNDLAGRNVAELSDGERQRVLIARALAQQPRVMLLDEPTAFLDLPRRVEVTGLLRRLARASGLAVLLSTHDMELALRHADTIWLVTPDRQLSSGAPEDLVLRGALEAAFRTGELTFDGRTGDFQLVRAPAGRARVRADGITGVWTRRALEREGFEVVHGEEPGRAIDLEVDYVETATGYLWRVSDGREIKFFPALAELAAFLRSRGELTKCSATWSGVIGP